jgi:superfamily I DNA/RNA helicase
VLASGRAVALLGPPGSGKTTTLLVRAVRATGDGTRIFVSAASGRAVARLRAELARLRPAAPPPCLTLGDLAFELIATLRPERSAERMTDVRASHVFEGVGARLYSLDWNEFVSAEIDPEITGLRSPQRFSAAAYRLIRKLRRAHISPQRFRELCERGATEFYGRLPNFAGADLMMDTLPKYRDSLRVGPSDLKRQHEREVDLFAILSKLYASYVDSLVARGCLTEADAIYEAIDLVRAEPAAARLYSAAFVDDAQDLTGGEIELLEALFGKELHGVTLAGDPNQATRTFAGARGDDTLRKLAAEPVTHASYRCAPEILALATRALADAAPAGASPGALASGSVAGADVGADSAVEFYRAPDVANEAAFVAATAQRLIRDGVAPDRIAVVTRSLVSAHAYIDALLAREVRLDVAGQASLYDYPAVQDGLAALWACADPFRHDYLMRNLEAPWLNFCDATIAVLCGEPSQPAPPPALFELPESDEDEPIRGRWNRLRDIRLGRNVTHGDVDADLPPEARERLAVFRAALERWQQHERTSDLPALARTILGESVLAVLGQGARARFERGLIERLLGEIDGFAAREPLASLADFLQYAESVALADADLLALDVRDPAAMHVLDVEAAKGREFDHVFVVDVRAGAFPRYYVPDAFLFTPRYGMVPKEDVGPGARTERTAKFTYVLFRLKLRDRYNQEERRAFYCAATRAREKLYVSAWGRPTRGVAAPEIFEELKPA